MKDTINLSLTPEEIISKISLKHTTPEDYVLIPQVATVREYVIDPLTPGRRVMNVIGESIVPGQYALVVKKFNNEDMEAVTEALHKGFYATHQLSSSSSYISVKKYTFSQVLEAIISGTPVSKDSYLITDAATNACTVIFKKIGKDMKLVSNALTKAGFTVDSEDSWNFLHVSMSKIGISKVPISLDEGIEYAEEFSSVSVAHMATVKSKSKSALRKIASILSERGLYVEFSEDDLLLTLKDSPENTSMAICSEDISEEVV